MEKFDGSFRSAYETALKYAAATAFLGKITQRQTNDG